MRISAGEFKGRRLVKPRDSRVRVTTERVREALFSILASEIPGAKVLDLYAGSGVVGLEAVSRGAAAVDFVDLSKHSLQAIRTNITALGVEDRTNVYRGDAVRYLERLGAKAYDLILADPPFSIDHAPKLVALFRETAFANLMSIEHRSSMTLTGDETRQYGDIALTFCFAP